MRVRQAKELFRQVTKEFFPGATVIWGRQSRIAKPKIPLVSLTSGNVRRPPHPVIKQIDSTSVAFYPTTMDVTVDLFTHGTPIQSKGRIVAYEDTALDDMMTFADFLGSQHVIDWCHSNDVAIAIEGDAADLTGIVNDDNYEYRAQLKLSFHFTQMAVGYAGVLDEGSVRYPMDRETWVAQHKRPDPDGSGDGSGDGDPSKPGDRYDPEKDPDVYIDPANPGIVFVPIQPPDTESTTGNPSGDRPGTSDPYKEAIVIPTFKPLPSGGGSQELADEELGYFTEAEVKEEEFE